MDEYSFISENGTVRQIRDLVAKAKDEEQDARISALEVEKGEPSIQNYKALMLLTPAGTTNGVDYKYTATQDCFFSLSQNWSGSLNAGRGMAVYLGTTEEKGVCVRVVPAVTKYGSGTTAGDIRDNPTIMTDPLFIQNGGVVWYKWNNYSNEPAVNARIRIFVKQS